MGIRKNKRTEAFSMTEQLFGTLPDGTAVSLLTLENKFLRCTLSTYGATLVSLEVKRANHSPLDVVLGYNTLEGYLAQSAFLGATIGRHANRIGASRFTLNGTEYILPANEGENQLHGGNGFDKRVWAASPAGDSAVTFTLVSPDGDQGFPGTLTASVTYALEENRLVLTYQANSDRDTVCNLTNHSYFNLNGQGSGSALGHVLQLHASAFTPVSSSACIPTGEIRPVEGTPMDFRTPTPMGQRIDQADEQLRFGNGYDHNWAIDGTVGQLRSAAVVKGDQSGLSMEVFTDLPGIQFYAANGLAGNPAGKDGTPYGNREAFCLETQFFPDAMNHPNFVQPILRAGEVWNSQTVYAFS
jgi:aldose 1-epimerase